MDDDAFAFEGLFALGSGPERSGSVGSSDCRGVRRPVLVVMVVVALLTVSMAGLLAGSALAQSGDGGSGESGEGGSDDSGSPVMVSTYTLKRLEADPWSGGVWIGMGTGLLFKSLPQAWEGGSGDAGAGGDGDSDGGSGGMRHLGPRNGLPSSIVNAVEVTPDRVYVGTPEGLAIVDKRTGEVLNATRPNGGVFDAYVHGIALERTDDAGDAGDGRAGDGDAGGSGASDSVLWVGTGSEGMFRVDPSTLVAEPVENPHEGSRFEDPVMDFAFDGEEMFISVNKYGVVRWDRATDETDRYRETARLDQPLYFRIALTPETVWVGTSYDGAIAYDRETGESQHYSSGDTLAGLNVFQVEAYGDDVWFTTDGGVARYDRSSDSWHNYQNPQTGWAFGKSSGFEMIDGTVYSASPTNQIARYDAVEDRWNQVYWWTSEEVAPWDAITSCTRFDEDRLLFTTGGRKTWFYEPDVGRWSSVAETLGDPEEGAPEILHRDAVADDRALWIATDDGLGRFDRGAETWTTHETFADHVSDQARNNVEDVDLTDASLWAAVMGDTYGHLDAWASGHVARYDRDAGEWTRWNKTDGLSGANVTVVEPVNGRVFVGYRNGAIDLLDPETGEVEHVDEAPAKGDRVRDFHVTERTLWAAKGDGLLTVNLTSLEVAQPSALEGTGLASVLSVEGGDVWAGGVENGLYRWNTSTGEAESYTLETGSDVWGYCLLERDGLLYVGTNRGIDRFDLERESFLPQYGTAARWLDAAGEGSIEESISIGSPAEGETVGMGGSLAVEGTSSGPPETIVQVRGAGSPWIDANGTSQWSAQIPLERAPTGETVLSARLVDGHEVLVQTAHTIEIVGADGGSDGQADGGQGDGGGGDGAAGSASSPAIEHEPLLVQYEGEASLVNVTVEPMPAELDARLVVAPPDGGDRVQTELAVADDRTLVGELPLFERPGSASYQIWLTWDDQRVRLPEADSPYGSAYPVAVRELEGIVSARLSLAGGAGGVGDDGGLLLAPGVEETVRLTLQNTGSRAGTFELSYSGSASDWLDEAPDNARVDAGTSRALELHFSVPAEAGDGGAEHSLDVRAVHAGYGASRPGDVSIPVTVGDQPSLNSDQAARESSSPGGEANRTPGPPLAAVLASALAAAAAGTRSPHRSR